ncbi:uncharacterized protein Z520_12016 [Fonsecaea multimorphosa CBS 102226]|uniref:TECPR1-like DysF domain-containing protein n=1 Tax=Fonsecaea multimorphosa CBS 102226 TaxID=1442371 RepID=A0A0D2GRX0_9EURO|nr:uncharacterized protein Z520_12016 [Fonsecaea multimorphosa CBS 102226]KIX92270.1 hypothetical protein Z520_12016 [Fonsecaea multimorphosa CBS 102226]OAL17643.1 hypothetical protein AYO22_11433 [Fonsecaea multimorphosa]
MSENVSKILTRITTYDGSAADPYDHEIALIDSTQPGNEAQSHGEPRSSSPSSSTGQLAKKGTRESLKEHLGRRKYAKYQQDRYHSKTGSIVTAEEPSSQSASTPQAQQVGTEAGTQEVDFAHTASATRGRKSAERRRREHKKAKHEIHEIDILYENQRGAFFCGIPLYSHSSLLPPDPSPWSNKDMKDSAVNITNAQVPDPTWEWAWNSWYVDMSHDVDEEGWQYSFAFGRSWTWHGTHPWFHSFVRRRRWLRKRVKREVHGSYGMPGSMSDAHHLTGDYFTIHSKRDRSPISAVDGAGKTARPSSFISFPSTIDQDQPPEEIRDIATLLTALKFAPIDREKIDVVKRFVQQGGEELVYLKDHIPDIMSFLVFQNSRRQLLSYLKKTANEAREHRRTHEEEDKPEGDAESRRIDNLLAAVEAADAEIGALEYWSDRKHVLKTDDAQSLATRPIATIFDQPAPKPKTDDDPVEEIKGISEKADITQGTTQSVFNPDRQSSIEDKQEQDKAKEKEDKGKGRAYDSEDDQVEQDSTPHLGADEVLVPDQD